MLISVVIPARNAAGTIGRAVAAATAQELPGDFEVIVVDDGSGDGTAAVAEQAGARVIAHASPQGPAASRNDGVAAARGEMIAFTDADCVPAPGWLRAGAAALEHADLVQGRVQPDPGVPRGPFDHTISVDAESGLYETANLFVRRDWFDRVGGFRAGIDPAEGHFGEDVKFGWAVRRAGGRNGFADGALVHHDVVARPASDWIRERTRLRLFPPLTRDVPELRSRYFMRLFLSRRTARFDLALAGLALALATRRPWPLLLALPYARRTLRRDQFWRRWVMRQNAAVVVGDCVGFGALVAGSVEARTPVL